MLLLGGGVTAAAAAYVALVDPSEPGHYPGCVLKLTTGLDCPACGGLRATHELLHGDVWAALDHNLLATVIMPMIVVAWFVALWRRRPGRATKPRVGRVSDQGRTTLVWAFIAVAAIFMVVRNLPFVPFLGSAAG